MELPLFFSAQNFFGGMHEHVRHFPVGADKLNVPSNRGENIVCESDHWHFARRDAGNSEPQLRIIRIRRR
jgi:hypothetical protein